MTDELLHVFQIAVLCWSGMALGFGVIIRILLDIKHKLEESQKNQN